MVEAYQKILDRAVRYANQDHRKPWYLMGETFRTPPDYESLELWYEPSTVRGAIQSQRERGGEELTEAEIMADLTIIIKQAIVRAIKEEPAAFGALLVSRARENPDPNTWFN